MPLSTAPHGFPLTVKAIEAGQGLQGQLAAMGLVPGAEIKVLRAAAGGPLLVSVLGSRIMLGRGMAHKIQVA